MSLKQTIFPGDFLEMNQARTCMCSLESEAIAHMCWSYPFPPLGFVMVEDRWAEVAYHLADS